MEDAAKEREEEAGGKTRRARHDTGRRPPRRPSGSVASRPRPQRRGRVGGAIARVIGLVATLALLGVGVAVLLTVTRDNGGKSEQETFAPTPASARCWGAGPRSPSPSRCWRRASRARASAPTRARS